MGHLAFSLSSLFEGVNLAFVLPLFLALIYLGLYVASGMTFGDVDGANDLPADADPHAGAHHPHPSAAGHDVVHHGPAKPDAHEGTFNLFGYFGVGRIPVSLWLSGLMLGWGAVGVAAGPVFRSQPSFSPGVATALLFAAATAGALATTRGLTVLLTRVIPLNETYARRRHDLLGSEGEAIYAIDGTFGMAGVRDPRGALFQVGCRAQTGEPIAKGARVKLVAYDRDTNLYHVVPAGQD